MNEKRIFFRQESSMDCGLASLKMICRAYNKEIDIEDIRNIASFEIRGTSFLGLYNAAKNLGLSPCSVQVPIDDIETLIEEKSPIIVHWKSNHFVVVLSKRREKYIVADPGYGIRRLRKRELEKKICVRNNNFAYAMYFKPSKAFFSLREEISKKRSFSKFFVETLKGNTFYFLSIGLTMLLALAFQFIMPFFSKALVDYGITSKSISYLSYIFYGQLAIVLSGALISFVRSWISLIFSNKVNYGLLSDFVKKLLGLPIVFFESRKLGEIIQRIYDHNRIENFITKTSFSFIFNIGSLIIFTSILIYYHYLFILLFSISTLLYLFWIYLFLDRRKQIDYERFYISSDIQNNLVQTIQGVKDIKLSNAEDLYFHRWSNLQNRLIENNVKSFKLTQIQDSGANLIYQLSNILMTFVSASLVISEKLSFGDMLAIQVIIGQLTLPVNQIINSIVLVQDSKISYNRISQISRLKNEKELLQNAGAININTIQSNKISFKHVYFEYPGQDNTFQINSLNITIPSKKTTAIVGLSGSGKTTILKLLLGYYDNYKGDIIVGEHNIKSIDLMSWRQRCGVVLQDSFIFNATIKENIIMSQDEDNKTLSRAIELACLKHYINGLPMGLETMIGNEGKGLSAGQKQRILIARALYKDPEYIFLDEATNSLDAETESDIVANLKEVFKGKTVIIIAHRLSTIEFADNIFVMREGKVVEMGTPHELLDNSGEYFSLVKKQLKLGI